jgi:hypothetical protein
VQQGIMFDHPMHHLFSRITAFRTMKNLIAN